MLRPQKQQNVHVTSRHTLWKHPCHIPEFLLWHVHHDNSLRRQWNVPMKSRPWPRYPSTWPPWQNSNPHVCLYSRESDILRDTQTASEHSGWKRNWQKSAGALGSGVQDPLASLPRFSHLICQFANWQHKMFTETDRQIETDRHTMSKLLHPTHHRHGV